MTESSIAFFGKCICRCTHSWAIELNTRGEIPYLGTLIYHSLFLAAERENRKLENLPQADFGRLSERFLLPVRTKSINENFVTWKLRPLMFCNPDSFFHLETLRQRFVWLSILFFSFIKSAFLVTTGLLCLYDTQNNTWLLVGIEFLCSC